MSTFSFASISSARKERKEQMELNVILEAKEKAEEIQMKTEAEFLRLKNELTKKLMYSVQDEIEHKKHEAIVGMKIERSRAVTAARMKRMQERDDIMKKLKKEVLYELAKVPHETGYANLVKYLIVQGLLMMNENKVEMQCRQEDLKIVESQVEPAVTLYQSYIQEQTGVIPKIKLILDKKKFLLPGPSNDPNDEKQFCCGGVVLMARKGQIVLRNTLESRLDLCFDNIVPQMRGLLFGVRASPKKAEKEVELEVEGQPASTTKPSAPEGERKEEKKQ